MSFRVTLLFAVLAIQQAHGLATPTLVSADETASAAAATTEWSQWRGPGRDSRLIDAAPWPADLKAAHLQQRWQKELGPSYSGPVLSKDLVFVTETRDRKFEVVRALKRADGEQVWEVTWEGAMSVPFFAASNGSWIRSTPAVDGDRLYVAGMRDVLVCLDTASGKERWRVDFTKQLKTPLPSFGFVCSPLVSGDSVYVQAGGSFVKLDKMTGEVRWRALQDGGGMNGGAFSSPTLANLGDQPTLVVQTRQSLAGVDPQSGKELWSKSIPAFRGMNILTPTVIGGAIFTSAYGGNSLLLEPRGSAGQLDVAEVWNNKLQAYMSSPVVVGDHVYVHLRNQRFACVDIRTGEITWTTTPFGKYWSMIANGDRILALDERGELLLIAADPTEFKLLDRRKISEESTWAHLAVSGDEVYIRSLNGLQAFRWKP